jgi:CheY-like chemotaxis protein
MRPPIGLAYSIERRVPASILLITPAVELANTVYGALEHGLGSRVWIWHELATEPAVRILGACAFRLILLDVPLAGVRLGSVLRAIKQAAPTTPLALLAAGAETPLRIERHALGDARARLAGATAVVPRADPAALEQAVRQILAMPVTNPPASA